MERFNSSFRGYDVKEVNRFVDETLKEYSAMLDKLRSKDAEINALENELAKFKSIKDMTDEISRSYESSNRIREVANEEARTIIEDAKKNASRIVNDALLEAERIEMHAEQLKRNMVVFKRRLRSALQTQLQTIEDIEEIKLDE